MPRKGYALVVDRANGWCEAYASRRCNGQGQHVHHRKLRSGGGLNTAGNCVHVCHECHSYIHANPADSYERGWLVHSWDEPGLVPFLRLGRFVLFDDEGGFDGC